MSCDHCDTLLSSSSLSWQDVKSDTMYCTTCMIQRKERLFIPTGILQELEWGWCFAVVGSELSKYTHKTPSKWFCAILKVIQQNMTDSDVLLLTDHHNETILKRDEIEQWCNVFLRET